jgi:hypothetical protein
MEQHKHFNQKTLSGIMAIALLFLIADIVVFALMFFNVDLNKVVNTFTENTVFNNLEVKTENTNLITIKPLGQTDNVK